MGSGSSRQGEAHHGDGLGAGEQRPGVGLDHAGERQHHGSYAWPAHSCSVPTGKQARIAVHYSLLSMQAGRERRTTVLAWSPVSSVQA